MKQGARLAGLGLRAACLLALFACAPGRASRTRCRRQFAPDGVFEGTPLQLYTYRPACTPRLVLIVFHGVQRDPGPYRDHARPLADGACAAIVAPEFDRARFPRDLYQYGGVGCTRPGAAAST